MAFIFWTVLGLHVHVYSVFAQSQQLPMDNSSAGFSVPRPRLRVATVLNDPWVMRSGDEYSGLIIDMLNRVANLSNFDYEIYESPDGKYGNLDYYTGHFTGIIGEIQANKADIGAADLTVTDARSQVVTFSSPFFETGAQILLLKPVRQANFMTPLLPFSVGVWCFVLLSFLVLGVLVCLINRLGHNGQREDLAKSHRTCGLGLCGNLTLQQNTTLALPASSAVLTKVWWCFILAALALYTPSLTCCLTASRANDGKLPFKSFHAMVAQSEISYGGWFGMILDHANDGLQRRMNRFISSKYTQYNSMEEAVSKLRASDGRFAAIVDGHRGKSLVNKNCDLILLSERIFSIYNSFACQKSHDGERICASLTEALSRLQDEGTIFSLFKHWLDKDSESQCSEVSEEDFGSRDGQPLVSFIPLTLVETTPLFVLVFIGVVLTLGILVAERKRNQTRIKKGQHWTGTKEIDELKHGINLKENNKRMPSRTSSYMSITLVSDQSDEKVL